MHARTSLPGALIALLLAIPACATNGSSSRERVLDATELKLAIVDAHGGERMDYCDPDFYPVQFEPELRSAQRARHYLLAHPMVFRALRRHEHIPARGPLTNGQLLRVYRAEKRTEFVHLKALGSGDYAFEIYLEHETASGTISESGDVRETSSTPNDYGCPICLARATRIATPDGPVSVMEVRVGTVVWSVDATGRRIRVRVLRIARTPVPPEHRVVRLALATGRTVLASPGHPTADGRTVGELRPGDVLDGERVVGATVVPYGGRFTFDLLPAGPTGTYFANGLLLGSTLAEPMGAPRASKAA